MSSPNDYILEQRARGVPDETIKAALAASGWQSEQVEGIFATLPPPSNPLQPLGAEAGPIPAELAGRWNWGGFLLGWIWGVFNGAPISLIVLIPVLGSLLSLPVAIYLGIKGNELAWKHRPAPVDEFKKRQHAWTLWGLIINLLFVTVFGALIAYSVKTNLAAFEQLGQQAQQQSQQEQLAGGTELTEADTLADHDEELGLWHPQHMAVVLPESDPVGEVWENELLNSAGGRCAYVENGAGTPACDAQSIQPLTITINPLTEIWQLPTAPGKVTTQATLTNQTNDVISYTTTPAVYRDALSGEVEAYQLLAYGDLPDTHFVFRYWSLAPFTQAQVDTFTDYLRQTQFASM